MRFSVLWPFEHPFYRRYGWATVSRYRWVKAPPEQLAFAAEGGDGGDEAGEFRRLDEDDHDAAANANCSGGAFTHRYRLTVAQPYRR